MKTSIIPIIILSLTIGVGCVDRQAQKQAKETEKLIKDETVVVETMTVSSSTVADTLDLTGTIETSDDASVTAIVGGPLVAIYVKDGDQVSAGQVIAKQDESDHRARVNQATALVRGAKATLDQTKADALVGPLKSEAQVKAGEARLEQAKARLQKLMNGARPEERRQAEAQLQRAKSDLQTAKLAVERAKRLHSEGAISKADLERSENQYSSALSGYESALEAQSLANNSSREEDVAAARQDVQAVEQQLAIDRANKRLDVLYSQRVESAQANHESARQTLQLAQIALDNTSLRAPFSGRISGKPLQVGNYVSPGVSVARVVGSGGAYFEAAVPESQINVVRTGISVDVTVDALGEKKVKGTLVGINPQATNAGRIFYARVRLDSMPEGIQSGMFARGSATISERSGVFLLPSQAILKEGDKSVVYLMKASKAVRKVVATGLTRNGATEVSGIESGETIIVKGQSSVTDGSSVSVASKPTVEKGA